MKKKNPEKKKGYRLDTREGVDKFLADIEPELKKSFDECIKPHSHLIKKLKHDY